jgi:hypothetical protein
MFELREGTIRNADNPSNPFRTLYVEGIGGERLVTSLTKWECLSAGFYFIFRGIFPKKPLK